MTLDALRDHCLGYPGAFEDLPFGPDALVFKVAGKMFALLSLDGLPPHVALKCDPERALELRERYAAVTPPAYFDKRHWNSVRLDGEVPSDEVRDLVAHSYALVVAGLPRRLREAIPDGPGAPPEK